MAYNLEPITRKENLLGLIAGNPHAEHREAITREEAFLSDIAENGGGGGSSLPPYTSADKGKVLTLGDGSGSETVVVVPEQTVTMEIVDGYGDAEISGNYDFFQNANEGDILNATIDENQVVLTGTRYTPPIGDPFIAFESGDIAIHINQFGTLMLSLENQDAGTRTITVSATASVPSVEPKWENTGLPVIRVSETLLGATLISTYSEVVEAYASGAALLNIETEIGKKCVLLSPVGYYHSETEHVFPAYTGYYIDETNVLDATVGFTQYKIDIDDTQQTVYLSVVKKNLVFQSQG